MLKEKLVSPVLMWFLIFSGIILILAIVPSISVFDRNIFTSFFLVLAIPAWLLIFGKAILIHRQAAQSVQKIDHLVISGIYKKVRHPIYSADMILAWSIFFFYPSLEILLSALWLSLVMFSWASLEEKYLIKKFGDDYLQYKSQVPMLIPKFFN